MIITIGAFTLDIDAEKTKRFYETAETVSRGCSCDGCRNFEKAIDTLPAEVTGLFDKLGIDMKKVCECYVSCPYDDGSLLYGGFYHVCGKVLAGESAWKHITDDHAVWDSDAWVAVTDTFSVSFREEVDLLEESFPLPAIQLEFSAVLPWTLDQDHPYTDR